MPSALASSRGVFLNWRLAVNGIQNASVRSGVSVARASGSAREGVSAADMAGLGQGLGTAGNAISVE